MHLLVFHEKVVPERVVPPTPKSIGIVANIAREAVLDISIFIIANQDTSYPLYRHEANTGQDAHDAEQLPKPWNGQHTEASNIYTVRLVHINTALHKYITR